MQNLTAIGVRRIRVLCGIWVVVCIVCCLAGLMSHKLTLNKWDMPTLRQKIDATSDLEECRALGKVALQVVGRDKNVFQTAFNFQMDFVICSGIICLLIFSVTVRMQNK